MPFVGERANKASHSDIVKNPDVARFLDGCEYLKPPSDEEGRAMAAHFGPPPEDAAELPGQVVAIDGSYHETCLNEKLPNTRVGFVKVGSVLIVMREFGSLRVDGGRYVDPFRVAKLRERNDALTFTLPSANLRTKGHPTVRESFRAAVDEHLHGPATRFKKDDPSTSLRTTLFHLASLRPGSAGTADPTRLTVHSCPACGREDVTLYDVPEPQTCPQCRSPIFPSDCLRVWEEVKDFQPNGESISRFMLAVEHMLPAHYVRYCRDNSPESLSELVFFVDGPLAVFGGAAWLHASIMRFLDGVNAGLDGLGYKPVLIIGLQKSGQLVDHFNLIDRYVGNDSLLAVDDDYRYGRVLGDRPHSARGFGEETYYGQDFLYKTPSGRRFVIGLPYPFRAKLGAESGGADFVRAKTEIARYTELARALKLVRHFECDLYRNAIVPVALAHRYTAISLAPGGRVLDLLTKKAMKERRPNEF